MRVPPFRGASVALCLALLSGCERETPRRLSVAVDTLVLYGYERTPLPVSGLVRSGEFTLTRRNRLRLSSDSAVEGRYGQLRCLKTGSATATVTVGGESVHFIVNCRPAVRVVPPSLRWMEPGGPPQTLTAEATLETGERVQLEPADVTLVPEGIARVAGNAVVPVTVGLARAYVDYGGLTVRFPIAVREVVAQDTFSLRPEEFRAWSLSRGRYEVTVRPVRAGDALQWLDLAAEGTLCSRTERSQETIYCVVYDHADLGVRNVAREAATIQRQAFVRVVRTP